MLLSFFLVCFDSLFLLFSFFLFVCFVLLLGCLFASSVVLFLFSAPCVLFRSLRVSFAPTSLWVVQDRSCRSQTGCICHVYEVLDQRSMLTKASFMTGVCLRLSLSALSGQSCLMGMHVEYAWLFVYPLTHSTAISVRYLPWKYSAETPRRRKASENVHKAAR